MTKTVSGMKAELAELKSGFASIKQNFDRQIATFKSTLAHSEKELKKYSQNPPGPQRDHYTLIYTLRARAAQRSIALLEILSTLDPRNPNAPLIHATRPPKLQALHNEIRYLSFEYSVVNYRPLATAVRKALAGGTGQLNGQRTGTGSLRGNTGQLAAPKGSGALPQQRPGTGRLQQGTPQVTGTGPLQAQNKPATGAISGQPARRPGTGPLPATGQLPPSAPNGTGALGNTGKLAGGTGGLGVEPNEGTSQRLLGQGLPRAAQDPGQRKLLETLLAQFQDLEDALGQLRGEQPGEASVPFSEIAEVLNKINGKFYYMKRTIDQLGPLGRVLAIEVEGSDPELQEFLAKNVNGPASNGGLASKLKSFLGL